MATRLHTIACLGLALALLLPSSRADPLRLLVNGDGRGLLENSAGIGMAQASAVVARQRKVTPGLVLLSTGSMFGPSSTSDLDGGAAVVDLMNLAGYDAMGLGVGDLFAGPANLLARVRQARFPVLSTNIRPTEDAASDLREGWEALERSVRIERDGVSVLVLGALSPATVRDAPGWSEDLAVHPVPDSLREERARAGEADLTVVVGTMTLEEAVGLLGELPWVDLLLLNRTARDQPLDSDALELTRRDGRRVVWTRLYGLEVAQIEVDPSRPGALRAWVDVLEVDEDDEPAPVAATRVAQAQGESELVLGDTLTNLTPGEAQDFAHTVLNGLRYELGAEVALVHRGGVLLRRSPETLTRSVLRQAFPFPDRAALLRVKGSALRDLWSRRYEGADRERHLAFAGLRERDGKLFVNGRELRNDERYRLATVEFLALGGQGALERRPEAVRSEFVIDLLLRYFSRETSRQRRIQRLEERPVVRSRTIVDVAHNENASGGSIDQFQFQVPGELGNFSDIPGLVGRSFRTLRVRLDQETVIDRPTGDLVFDLEMNLSEFDSLRTANRAELDVRYEEKAPGSAAPRMFGSLQLQRPLIEFELAGRSSPFFGRAVGGLIWRPEEGVKLRAGAGALFRFSQPGSPEDPGLSFGYQVRKTLRERFEVRLEADSFLSVDSDDIRTAELTNELRIRLGGSFSAVYRHFFFTWKDSTVGEAATRSEVFWGLSFDRSLRRF